VGTPERFLPTTGPSALQQGRFIILPIRGEAIPQRHCGHIAQWVVLPRGASRKGQSPDFRHEILCSKSQFKVLDWNVSKNLPLWNHREKRASCEEPANYVSGTTRDH